MASTLKRLARMAPELLLRTILIALVLLLLGAIARNGFGLPVPVFAWLAAAAAALWLPMTIGLYLRTGEAGFTTRRELTRRQKLRRWAGALWTTPLIMLIPLWLPLLLEPSLLREYWRLCALLLGPPFAAAALLYASAARSDAVQ